MKKYAPIAVYDNETDIKNLFPGDFTKRQLFADHIIHEYLAGKGNPRELPGYDEESVWDEKEIADDNANFYRVGDEYGVRFTQGVINKKGKYIGFFIDIYKVIDEGDAEPEFTDERLKLIARNRRDENSKIKQVIIREFKERFTKPGTGLDFYQYCPDDVTGYGESIGTIGRMILGQDGEVYVYLIQEYEDDEEHFEDEFFGCDDWPQLLLNLRRGIQDGWEIEE